MARIAVKVHPHAKRSAVAGRLGDAWKLHLAAPPVEGKANEELIRFLSDCFHIPRSRVRILTGASSRTKIVEIEGLSQPEAESRLLNS